MSSLHSCWKIFAIGKSTFAYLCIAQKKSLVDLPRGERDGKCLLSRTYNTLTERVIPIFRAQVGRQYRVPLSQGRIYHWKPWTDRYRVSLYHPRMA